MPETTTLEILEKGVGLKIAKKFDPASFFKDRAGLYIWSSFTERILSKAEVIEKATDYTVASYKLTRSANDEEIERDLPEKHIFTESEVCAVIAALIEKQPHGEEGVLLNTGWWNLFYTPAFGVSVGWYGVGWYVDTWLRVEGHWVGSHRVFSPAN